MAELFGRVFGLSSADFTSVKSRPATLYKTDGDHRYTAIDYHKIGVLSIPQIFWFLPLLGGGQRRGYVAEMMFAQYPTLYPSPKSGRERNEWNKNKTPSDEEGCFVLSVLDYEFLRACMHSRQ